jgi:hypothetical protein
MRHAVEIANYGTKPLSFEIVQWLNESNASAFRGNGIDVHLSAVSRLPENSAMVAAGAHSNAERSSLLALTTGQRDVLGAKPPQCHSVSSAS